MLNSPFRWKQPTKTGSPIGKGAKTRAKVTQTIGRKRDFTKYITGR